jgi:hypothetical protein
MGCEEFMGSRSKSWSEGCEIRAVGLSNLGIVPIVERGSTIDPSGAGIQMTPNVSRQLQSHREGRFRQIAQRRPQDEV